MSTFYSQNLHSEPYTAYWCVGLLRIVLSHSVLFGFAVQNNANNPANLVYTQIKTNADDSAKNTLKSTFIYIYILYGSKWMWRMNCVDGVTLPQYLL